LLFIGIVGTKILLTPVKKKKKKKNFLSLPGYPDYFPAKTGFLEAVKEIETSGNFIFPYINGRIWDFNALSWEDENAMEFSAKKAAPRLSPLTLQNFVER
jgi:hypothetical protein